MHTLTHTDTPCSIHYNKSTILAPTCDDSIGRSPMGPGSFLRITRLRFTSRARCTSHRRDVLGMLLSSPDSCCPPPLSHERLFVTGEPPVELALRKKRQPPRSAYVLRHCCLRARSNWHEMDLAFGAVEFLGCFFFQLIDSIAGNSRA